MLHECKARSYVLILSLPQRAGESGFIAYKRTYHSSNIENLQTLSNPEITC